MENHPGWRVRAIINPTDADRLSADLSSVKMPHDIDRSTGAVVAIAKDPEMAMFAAQAIGQDYQLKPPSRDMVNQGIPAHTRVWMQFSAGNDLRFESYGTAGIPFLKDDMAKLNDSKTGTQLEIDRAVMRSNEMLAHHYGDRFGEAASFGWVVTIHAGSRSADVAQALAEAGHQNRISKDGTTTVIAYAGSMAAADDIARNVSARFGNDLHDNSPSDRHRFAKGIEGHFVPDTPERLITDQSRGFVKGLPILHETAMDQGMTNQERYQRSAETMQTSYGEYFSGESRDIVRDAYAVYLKVQAKSGGMTVEALQETKAALTVDEFRHDILAGKHGVYVERAQRAKGGQRDHGAGL